MQSPKAKSIPAWIEDQLNYPGSPTTSVAFFDDDLDAWVLTRHEDVLAAFRAAALFPTGATHAPAAGPPLESAWMAMRAETIEALSAARLSAWREALLSEACSAVENLHAGEPVDLLSAYARPLCHSLAAMVTGLSREQCVQLEASAQQISSAAAEPFDPVLRSRAKSAERAISSYFPSGPETLRVSGFVAVSQTLPCLLANVWFVLIQAPGQWSLLHKTPDRTEAAIEELLRCAGLARTLSRQAADDLELNGVLIRRGQRVILRIIAASHDPARIDHPHVVDVQRHAGGHFTFGAGSHACVAAGLIRMAAGTMTAALVQRFAEATLVQPVAWKGGSGYLSPAGLMVQLGGRDAT